MCEKLGHCDFGKVYKGVMKTPLCITHGPSTQETIEKKKQLTRTVVVKMLEGSVRTELLTGFRVSLGLTVIRKRGQKIYLLGVKIGKFSSLAIKSVKNERYCTVKTRV